MKYSEFREYLKINEIHIQEDKERIIAAHQFEISKAEEHSIIFLIDLVDFPCDFQLLKKVIELAETPLDEREEEKKYYLKYRFINKYSTEKYIDLSITGTVEIRDRCGNQIEQSIFTKAEFEELKEEFNTDFNDFILVRVED